MPSTVVLGLFVKAIDNYKPNLRSLIWRLVFPEATEEEVEAMESYFAVMVATGARGIRLDNLWFSEPGCLGGCGCSRLMLTSSSCEPVYHFPDEDYEPGEDYEPPENWQVCGIFPGQWISISISFNYDEELSCCSAGWCRIIFRIHNSEPENYPADTLVYNYDAIESFIPPDGSTVEWRRN